MQNLLLKNRKLRKNAKKFLVVSLIICFLSSFCASLIQTNGYSVQITHLNRAFTITDSNVTPASVTLDALIYKPKNATKENPAPVIFCIHGTINNKEYQDMNAIELARRGFVVIAFDLVTHGNSQVTSVRGDGIIQLIEYACTLDYVDGTKVGVGGHSRGGGIAASAADYYNDKGMKAYDKSLKDAGVTEATATSEQLAAARKAEDMANRIAAVLSVECTPYTMNPGQAAITKTYYGHKTSVGTIAGQYDEFFFKDAGKYTGYNAAFPVTDADRTNKAKYEWLPKDYLTSAGAARLISGVYTGLQTTTRHTVPIEGEPGYDPSLPVPANNPIITLPSEPIKANTYYTASGPAADISATNPATSAFRIIYNPAINHPWATFSSRAAADQINFYYAALGVPHGATYLNSGNQTWFIKELFNLVGLIGIVMFVIAFAEVILVIPYFSKLRRRNTAEDGSALSAEDLTPDALGLNDNLPELKGWKRHLLFWIPGITTSLFCGFTIRYFTSTTWGYGSALMPTSTWFNQNYVNMVAVWAVLTTAVTLLVYAASQWIFGRRLGDRPFEKAITTGANAWRAILGALLVVSAACLIELFSSKVFHTDYRFYTLAFRAFQAIKIPTMLRYSFVFGFFYVVNAIINANNRYKNLPEWASIAITAFFNIFGIVLVMAIQYTVLFSTGNAWQNDTSNAYCVLYPIAPMMIAAAIIARKVYLRTGNVWYSGFVNTFLMTVVMCANTSAAAAYPYIFF